jgi:hypothetical protein
VAEALSKIKVFHGICGDFVPNSDGYFEGKATIKMIKNGKAVVIGE